MTDAAAETKWTARTALSRFGEVARDEGARALWFKVWGELCYRRLALFELPLDSPVPQISSRARDLVSSDVARSATSVSTCSSRRRTDS